MVTAPQASLKMKSSRRQNPVYNFYLLDLDHRHWHGAGLFHQTWSNQLTEYDQYEKLQRTERAEVPEQKHAPQTLEESFCKWRHTTNSVSNYSHKDTAENSPTTVWTVRLVVPKTLLLIVTDVFFQWMLLPGKTTRVCLLKETLLKLHRETVNLEKAEQQSLNISI